MATLEQEIVMRVDNVDWKDWQKAEKEMNKKGLWYTVSDNSEGYNLVETEEETYSIFLETNILTQEQVDTCKQMKAEKLLIVFK